MSECVTVTFGDDKQWQAAIYIAKPRQEDGVQTWRRERDVGQSSHSIHSADRIAREYAATHGIPYVIGMRQGRLVNP